MKEENTIIVILTLLIIGLIIFIGLLTIKLGSTQGKLRFMNDYVKCMDYQNRYMGLHQDVREYCLDNL